MDPSHLCTSIKSNRLRWLVDPVIGTQAETCISDLFLDLQPSTQLSLQLHRLLLSVIYCWLLIAHHGDRRLETPVEALTVQCVQLSGMLSCQSWTDSLWASG
jgi:hypothetical protein